MGKACEKVPKVGKTDKKKKLGQAPALPLGLWKEWLQWLKQTAGPRIYAVVFLTGAFGLRCGEAVTLRREEMAVDAAIPKITITGETRGAKKSPGERRSKIMFPLFGGCFGVDFFITFLVSFATFVVHLGCLGWRHNGPPPGGRIFALSFKLCTEAPGSWIFQRKPCLSLLEELCRSAVRIVGQVKSTYGCSTLRS